MASTVTGSNKPKCKYWGKCFRKDKQHIAQYLHPTADDTSDTTVDNSATDDTVVVTDTAKTSSPNDVIGGTSGTASKLNAKPVKAVTPKASTPKAATPKVSTRSQNVDLGGKTVLFLGTFGKYSIDQMSARAEVFGCQVAEEIAEDVDMVIVGKKPGNKEAEAKELGLRMVTVDYWDDLVSRSKPKPQTASGDKMATNTKPAASKTTKPNLKRQRTHNVSDSDGEGTTDGKKMADSDMDTSDENEAATKTNSAKKPGENDATKAKKQKTSDTGDAATSTTVKSPKKIAKCKYWDKCYRKEADHLKTFLHPSDDPSELVDDSPGTLADGETADVQAGKMTYRIKRTGTTYYCNCIGWKTQNKAVDMKTCRHLKEYLGEEIECKRVGAAMPTENKGGAATIFRSPKHKQVSVLLAHKYTEGVDPTGWWISEKLDGVRAYWDGKGFYSRLGNEFIPPPWFIENFPSDMTLDGELFGGRSKFQKTVSIVKNAGSARWNELEYHIFDAPSLGKQGFETRIKAAKDYFEKNTSKTAVVVEHTKCTGRAQIKEELTKVETLGGEGLMIREPNSKYEQRRSHTLLKIKTFYDAEAVVIGHERGKGRNASVTGALRCRMECGKEFSVGSGLNDQQRKSPPKVGTIITYKFQEYTNSGSPRFPTFIGVRIDMDGPKDAVLPAGKLMNQGNNDA